MPLSRNASSPWLIMALPFLLWSQIALCQTLKPLEPVSGYTSDLPTSQINVQKQTGFDKHFLQEALPAESSGGGGTKHVFLSLLLPGLGEWVMGHKGLGKFFVGTEVTFWIGYLASREYVSILQDDLEAYAAAHAGVNTRGKDGQYWIDVGSAGSIYEYNADKLLERDIDATYPEGSQYDWQWDSEQSRVTYVNRRFDRLDWKRATNLMIGALVLNRIVSAIDVVRLIRKDNNAENGQEKARDSYLHLNYGHNRFQGDVVRFSFTWLLD